VTCSNARTHVQMCQCLEAMTHLPLHLGKNMKDVAASLEFLSAESASHCSVVVVVVLLWRIHTSLPSPLLKEPISGSVWPDLVSGEPEKGREKRKIEATNEEERQGR